jgi:hypothetical protein
MYQLLHQTMPMADSIGIGVGNCQRHAMKLRTTQVEHPVKPVLHLMSQ